MAYSSLIDARTKVTNPRAENASATLYASNASLDLTTIFYTNEAKTTLAPAGNYVIPTNYLTYYITLGNDGKMTGAPQELMQGTDTSWVEDRLKDGDNLVSNQSSVGGTSLSLSGSLLTDAVWSSRPYIESKKWMIDVGTLNSSSITNIDLSAMKGYDLRLITGEYYDNVFGLRDNNINATSAIIHLAPDENRQHIVGNKTYFFRPDYWIPDITHNTPSYFRRMPDITPIQNERGADKKWVDMAVPLMDILYTGSHSVRTSTRLNKGITESADVSTQWGYNQQIAKDRKLHFDGDGIFRTAVSNAWGVDYHTVDLSDLWQYRTMALLMAHDVPENERSTWTFSGGGYTYTYAQANPYSWTTEWGSGASGTEGFASQMLGYFVELQPFNSAHFEYDFEYISPALFSEAAGVIWNKCFKSALAKAQELKNSNTTYYIDWVTPQFSNYGNGIYQSRYIASAGYGWESMEPGNSITSTKLYSDYHDYYTNGTITYYQTGAYYPWFKGAIENYKYHYVTNYQLRMKQQFQVYSIVHNTDITKKMFEDILGPNHDRLACGYFWYYQEPIEGSDFRYIRKEVNLNGSLRFTDRNRLEVCPSLMYAMAVWCMCYADGLFMWYQSVVGEEVAAARLDRQNNGIDDAILDAKWGNTTWVGKSSLDWAYVGYLHAKQNEDIISATTEWLVPDLSLGGGSWTTGTANYPVSLYNNSRPICRYKLSQDGTEALVLIYNGFNNGYTKDTFTFRLPAKSNYQFTADVWGNYTTVLRIKNL
jgi:hypothetical protein